MLGALVLRLPAAQWHRPGVPLPIEDLGRRANTSRWALIPSPCCWCWHCLRPCRSPDRRPPSTSARRTPRRTARPSSAWPRSSTSSSAKTSVGGGTCWSGYGRRSAATGCWSRRSWWVFSATSASPRPGEPGTPSSPTDPATRPTPCPTGRFAAGSPSTASGAALSALALRHDGRGQHPDPLTRRLLGHPSLERHDRPPAATRGPRLRGRRLVTDPLQILWQARFALDLLDEG